MLVLARIVSLALIFHQISMNLAKKSKLLPGSTGSTACTGLPDGLYPDPKSCGSFIHCHQNGQAAHKRCPPKTLFNTALKVCDWARNVTCGVKRRTIVPTKPRRFSARELNGTTFQLSWRVPARYSKPLVQYVIWYQRQHTGPSMRPSQIILQPDVLSYKLSGLLPGSNYVVEIQAENNVGLGKKAKLKVNTPLEVPQEPKNLSGKPLGPTAISIKWKDPKLSNDHILSYTITYGVAGLKIGQNSIRLYGYANTAVLTNLLPGVEYEIKVQALSFGGFGKPGVIKVTTSSGDLCPPGEYSETGKKPCCKCAYGRYQSRTGKKKCIKCHRGMITLKRGAKSFKDCVKVTTD